VRPKRPRRTEKIRLVRGEPLSPRWLHAPRRCLIQATVHPLDDRSLEMPVVTLSAVIHRDNDLYVAECPELGTVSQGRTIEEAVANLKEATELYLEEQEKPLTVGPVILTTFSIDTSNAEAA